MADNKLFIAWLNDAHAFEKTLAATLEEQVKVAADHPAVQQGIERHLEQTKQHAETLEGCLQELGESPSSVKDAMGTIGGKIQSMMPGAAKDDLLKAALNDYSAEHMEIASYQSLIVAANELGLSGIATRLEGILAEEQAMATWLEESIPLLTREALAKGGNQG
jgi:ferritin-like metal-binding protein YciE